MAKGSLKPTLIVVVDTEEEFDWRQPYSRSAVGVSHMEHQGRAQRVLQKFGVRPTYVVDYPIAVEERAFRPLREWFTDGHCKLGAHLHPWVTPPFTEELSTFNSYPGNLPVSLERAKLSRLTESIECNLGVRPKAYRAGRYGIGPMTATVLDELGYNIDTSVVPFTDFSGDGGPDFKKYTQELFWIDPNKRVLEVPLTVGWCGLLRTHGATLQSFLLSKCGMKLHAPGVCARLGLFERIRLTPEGTTLVELKRLTETLLACGTRVFVFSYHSPSVEPGNTPYVRNDKELEEFLARIDGYCEYFLGDCGGVSSSLEELRESLIPSDISPIASDIRPAG